MNINTLVLQENRGRIFCCTSQERTILRIYEVYVILNGALPLPREILIPPERRRWRDGMNVNTLVSDKKTGLNCCCTSTFELKIERRGKREPGRRYSQVFRYNPIYEAEQNEL